MTTFGQHIRDLRREQGLTQRQLAGQLQAKGLRADFTYLSKIETGRADVPPSEELIRGLADIFQRDPEELLDLAGKISPRALQEAAIENPETGLLLRRIQARRVSPDVIRRILEETEKRDDD